MVLKNPSCDNYFWFFNFWATFGGKMGAASKHASNGLGLPNLTKKLANWVDLFSQPLSRNHVSEIFKGENPLP